MLENIERGSRSKKKLGTTDLEILASSKNFVDRLDNLAALFFFFHVISF